ncbi:MAG: hypothetical protein M3Q61_05545 [Chloroflexota bacterium]|nr:hypothetical protein [Chloroflexota bacterium]
MVISKDPAVIKAHEDTNAKRLAEFVARAKLTPAQAAEVSAAQADMNRAFAAQLGPLEEEIDRAITSTNEAERASLEARVRAAMDPITEPLRDRVRAVSPEAAANYKYLGPLHSYENHGILRKVLRAYGSPSDPPTNQPPPVVRVADPRQR